MPKVMLINVTHSEESRVGIVNDGVLESFEIESLSREHLKGNIYKGKIHRIHPALEAAFVDIGAERDAFLPIDEICFRNLSRPTPPASGGDDGAKRGSRRRRIRDLFRPNEEVLVQITKEEFGNKPPTLTTFYSLPGRYLVLLAGSDENGISRRIEGEDRIRLRKLLSELNPPEGFGIIVRTAAGFDQDTHELERDLAYLQRLWETIQQTADHKHAPALVYREHDIVLRTIRDFFTPDIDEIYIDNEDVYQRAREFVRDVMPGREHVLHLYTGEQPIFSAFDVESQFESIFKRRVQLKSGGGIVIDGTEALTAIDVNSGGSVRGPNPEETAFRTNLEAANEIARQLRLRDIGGIIVVDFIDMRDVGHIHEIERAMRDALKPDKARHEVGRISRLGLLEISRQRMRPAAMATTYATCPMCEGHGAVRTTESAALVALRKIHNRVAPGNVASLRVHLPNDVAIYLLNQKRDDLAQLEQRYRTRIQVSLSAKLMSHQIELEAKVREVDAGATTGTPAAADSTAAAGTAADSVATTNGSGKRRRRRGRRRGRGKRAAAAIGEALAALGASAGLLPPASNGADEVSAETEAEDAGSITRSESGFVEQSVRTDAEPAAPADVDSDAPIARPTGTRRRRRGGRGRGRRAAVTAVAGDPPHEHEAIASATTAPPAVVHEPAGSQSVGETARPHKRSRRSGTRRAPESADAAPRPVRAKRAREPRADADPAPTPGADSNARPKRAPRRRRSPTSPRAKRPPVSD